MLETSERIDRLEGMMAEIAHAQMRGFNDESERDRKRMNKAWGDLTNKLGTTVEDIVAPNIPRIGIFASWCLAVPVQKAIKQARQDSTCGSVTID